jgi:(R,R)-butanediol dehydrogenase/meso-butanediol dehydrogenase/diacetyl reductase
MRAAVYHGAGDVRVETVPAPVPGPRDVVVDVVACGICGSDLHAYEHGRFLREGQVMGHEISGEIAAVGADVRGLEAGDRVAVMPYVSCGHCAMCRRGTPHLCRSVTTDSIAYGRPGGFADAVLVPDAVLGHNVHPLPAGMSFETAALAEPLAVVLHALRLGGLPPSATVAVTGLGPIGLLAVAALRHDGAARILASDLIAGRRTTAEALGATDVLDPATTSLKAYARERDVVLDAVFEVSGSAAAFEDAVSAVRPGGRLVALAIYAGEVRLNPSRLVQLELGLQGSFAATPRDFAEALALLAGALLPSDAVVSHRFGLADAPAAFAAQADRVSSTKVMIMPKEASPR